ncbi:MAG: hypothetical protein KGD64_01380 [Candidatus Heimdallarchaeota archaeon]|nr:hypothetical protein [Candidatus Heimdallarchaeota archaeon]
MTIEKEYLDPRKGFLGEWDKFIGPGANKVELLLILGIALIAGLVMLFFGIFGNLNWNILQIILATLIAVDLGGGVVANAASPAKRWYHREGQGFWKHMIFVLFHIYSFIVAFLFRPTDWVYGIVIYGYLIISSIIIILIPLYLQRPTSVILFSGAIMINWYGFSSTPGLEWFIPVLFLKLLLGHLVKEEPYRPEK